MKEAFLTRHMATKAFYYIPKSKVVYLNNPKVACSTIKKSLWLWHDSERWKKTYAGNPHSHVSSPFCRSLEQIARQDGDFIGATFFTVVRNPYVRLLSAYLNKIDSSRRDQAVWQPIARRFGFGTRIPSFAEFVKAMSSEVPELMDQHFAPQHAAILSHAVTPDFIGHLENMPEVEDFLRKRRIPVENHTPHVTGATAKLNEFYTDREIEIVREFYADDFRYFGYSDSISQIAPVRPAAPPQLDRRKLQLLLKCWTDSALRNRKEALIGLQTMQGDAAINLTFVALEAGTLNLRELMELRQKAAGIRNWRYLSKLAQELAQRDAVREAAAVMSIAAKAMTDDGVRPVLRPHEAPRLASV